MSEELKPTDKLTTEDVKSATTLRDKLPDDTFVTIPSDVEVTISMDGRFIEMIKGLKQHIYNTMPEDILVKKLIALKVNYEGVPPEEINDHDRALYTIMNLVHEIDFQASKQSKTRVYDKDAYYDKLEEIIGNPEAEPLQPLSNEEVDSRVDKANEDSNQQSPHTEV